MTRSRIRAEHPRGGPLRPDERVPEPVVSKDVVTPYEEDAARVHGSASGVVRPRDEREVALIVAAATREKRSLVVQGARSSLTGGATPKDDLVLSTELMDRLVELDVHPELGGRAVAEPGLRLRTLNERALARGRYFPPVPTYDLCCLGGAVATCAAGAVTFKHGSVRGWIRGLRVVLAWGDVLAVRRGQCFASPDRTFEIVTTSGEVVTVPLPSYTTPAIKKISCGYWSRDGMDLVDLFIGAEGTLGVVTEIEVALASAPACVVTGLAVLPDEPRAFAFASDVRRASEATWMSGERSGVDVRAIEYVDAASIALVRARGRRHAPLPPEGRCAVLWEQELPARLSREAAAQAIGRGLAGDVTRGARDAEGDAEAALSALGALLARHGAGDEVLLALPDDAATARAIADVRESVPEAVNDLVAERKRTDPGVKKVASDMAVAPARLDEWTRRARALFSERGLDHVVFGHVSDGNLHVNVLARDAAQARLGEEALLELGDLTKTMGGAPLAEHGVGKSPTKQALLARFHGPALRSAAATKRALDPSLVLAPGNVLPREMLGADTSGLATIE